VLSEAAVENDVIQIYTLKNFRVPNTYTIAQTDDQFLTKTSASGTYLTQSSASTTYAPVAAGGLVQIVPTSITATGGSGSISSTGAVSFTSASAIGINGCFTSTYDDYRIIFKLTAGTQTTRMRLRVAGADNTTSNYANQVYFGGYTNSSANTGATGATSWPNSGAGELTVQTIDIMSPFTTANTTLHTLYSHDANAGLRIYQFRANTSFDGISVFPDSGTISGSFVIYGYKK
jgi:hypothetical protein